MGGSEDHMTEQDARLDGNHPPEAYFWVCTGVLFLVIFATNQRILGWLDLKPTLQLFGTRVSTINEIIAPVRGIAFLLALATLLRPLFHDLRSGYQQLARPSLWTALFAFLVLAVLLVPQGLRGLGQEYGSQSLLVFTKTGTVASYQRFLMPALAYVAFLRGSIFFFIFSLGCTLGLIHLTHLWLVNNRILLPFWDLVSVLTCSFVAAQFQIPGYPDGLVFILFLLLVMIPLSDVSKLSLVVLSLSAHEASLLLYGVLGVFHFTKSRLAKLYAVLAIYVLIWMGSEGFDLAALVNHRPQPSATADLTSLQWLQGNPIREVMGIFFAYKLLWILIVWAVVLLVAKRDFRSSTQIILLLATGAAMTFLAVDTSRLMGWSFYGLLLSLKVIHEAGQPRIGRMAIAIYAANLLVPSAYVGLNLGMMLPPGLYLWVWQLKDLLFSIWR
jgi:hypothetical protein